MADARASECDHHVVALGVVTDAADQLDAAARARRPRARSGRTAGPAAPLAARPGRPTTTITARLTARSRTYSGDASAGTTITSPRPASRSGASTCLASPTITIDRSSGRMLRWAAVRTASASTAATCGTVPVELVVGQLVDDEARQRAGDLAGGLEAQREDAHQVVARERDLVVGRRRLGHLANDAQRLHERRHGDRRLDRAPNGERARRGGASRTTSGCRRSSPSPRGSRGSGASGTCRPGSR